MKDKVAKFLNNNCVTIILYFGLFLIAMGSSIIGVIVYGLTIHTMLFGLIIGLYKPEYIEEVDALIEKLKVSSGYIVRAKFRLISHCIFSVCVLIIYDQLYLATITIAIYALLYVYTIDAGKTAKKSLEEMEKLP
jgi:hypothetical protein